MPSPPGCSEVTVGKGRFTHGKESLHRGMEPSPGDGSGRGGRKAAVWTGEGEDSLEAEA